MLPGSSVAEQVTVNHLVAGSIPARAAISTKEMRNLRLRRKLTIPLQSGFARPQQTIARRRVVRNFKAGLKRFSQIIAPVITKVHSLAHLSIAFRAATKHRSRERTIFVEVVIDAGR